MGISEESLEFLLSYVEKHGDTTEAPRAANLLRQVQEKHPKAHDAGSEPLEGKGQVVGEGKPPFAPAHEVAAKVGDQAKTSAKP